MVSQKKRTWIDKLFGGYLSKNVLPYWCVVLADTVIVLVSTAFVYWASSVRGSSGRILASCVTRGSWTC